MLKKMLQDRGWASNGVLLAHWMNWFGDNHYHPMNAYNSSMVSTINAQLDVMQWAGVDGIIVTWQGSKNQFGQLATMLMNEMLVKRGMQLCLLADPWLMNNQPNGEAAVISELLSIDGLTLLNSPAYIPEMYFLDFTNNLFNGQKVQDTLKLKFPNFTVLKRHVGYSWPEIVGTLSTLKIDNSNPAMKMPGLFYKFFDGGDPSAGTIDWNKQNWQTGQPSRSIEDQAGNTFFDCLSVTPLQSKYLVLVTWNDYNERTPWEPILSILAGKRIS